MVADELEFYVASGKTRQISVRAKNLLDFMTDFKCQLKIEHSVHERLARKQGDVIMFVAYYTSLRYCYWSGAYFMISNCEAINESYVNLMQEFP